MPSKISTRSTSHAAAANKPTKRARIATKVQLNPSPTDESDILFSSTAPHHNPPSSRSSSSTSFTRPTQWDSLPLELLLLIADCYPSYRLLLPLSSTNRHFYEVIHEEEAAGLAVVNNSVHDLTVRASCWRHHPTVRLVVEKEKLVVDGVTHDYATGKGESPLVSYVLTSLRHVSSLELTYTCRGGPHTANLYPLRHFTHLRSLVLVLGDESYDREQSLNDELSTALFSLSSLVSLSLPYTAVRSRVDVPNFTLSAATLQQLAGRTLHLTLNSAQLQQLTSPVPSIGRRKQNKKPPFTYPAIQSVAITSQDRLDTQTSIRELIRTFIQVKHVVLGAFTMLSTDELCDVSSPIESLHAHIRLIRPTHDVRQIYADSRLRCLSLRCDQCVALIVTETSPNCST